MKRVASHFSPIRYLRGQDICEIWAYLLKKGTPVGAHDLMIASTAISLGFSVATHNVRDFKKIEGLTFEML